MMEKTPKRKELTLAQRQSAYCIMYQSLKNGVLPRGIFTSTAKLFNVNPTTVARLWRDTNAKIADEGVTALSILTDTDFFESKSKNRGRPLKWNREEVREEVRSVPLSLRQTWDGLSHALKVPASTLRHMNTKENLFYCHSSSLLPDLTDDHKMARLSHALDEIHLGTVNNSTQTAYYKNMYDRVDLDEKWFYMMHENAHYILVGDRPEGIYNGGEGDLNHLVEEIPQRQVHHRCRITKVMFLCAQARPRWDPATNAMWDGKLGIWPIGHCAHTQRRILNQEAGEEIWVDKKITKVKYREMLITRVIDSIIKKWPRSQWNNPQFIIRIQQDGAKAHIDPDDKEFYSKLVQLGVEDKILIYTQPANSPDTNINDLGFFRTLQLKYHCNTPNDAIGIIKHVKKAHADYDYKKINRIWLSLMRCYNSIIECNGGNNYTIPKDKLEQISQLPVVIPVTKEAFKFL